jgi:ankyrin repeat protein
MEIIKLLLENGATLEKRGGITPIVEAARMYPNQNEETAKGITEIVKMLLGDQSVNTLYGSETLLFYAVRAENIYLVEYLLSQGCDKNIQNYDGKTALDYAVERGYVEIVDLLS